MRSSSLITPDYIGFGFGQEGKVIGEKLYRASLEREFAQCESLKLQYTWMAISSEGPVAWVASECTLTATRRREDTHLSGKDDHDPQERGGAVAARAQSLLSAGT
jgi:hypothetical protein